MNTYRRVALAALAGTAGLSLAACSAGIITTSPKSPAAPARPAATSHSAPPHSPSASPKPSPSATSSPVRTIQVNAPIRTLPIPPGVQVLTNASCYKQVGVEVGPITPRQAFAFYSKALPQAGYQITDTMLGAPPGTGLHGSMAEISFTGHGYSGDFTGFSDMSDGSSPAPDLGAFSIMTKNVAIILLNRPGVPDSYNCPGT